MRQTCLKMVHQLARQDPRVVFIGSDLSPGLLDDMKQEFPLRHYMEGISEQHVVGMAAGMALEGWRPYVNTIATFLTRRCYEQVALDLCLHDLPVTLIGNGGGLVYAPLGPTHQAIEDLAIMRALPNMTVLAPADAGEMVRLMPATLSWPHPIYLRLGKGGDPVVTREQDGFTIGQGYLLHQPGTTGAPVLLASTGIMTGRTLTAARRLEAEGIPCQVLHLPTVKPLDAAQVTALAQAAALVVTVEEHSLIGGLGSALADTLLERLNGRVPRLLRLGLSDAFVRDYGSQDSLLQAAGLDPAGIAGSVRRALTG